MLLFLDLRLLTFGGNGRQHEQICISLQIHGWLMCLAWGWFIPAGIVIAGFRSVTRLGANWWYYVHIVFACLGLLLSLAGTTVATYFPANEELMVQHKIIGVVVNVVAGLQVRVWMAT